MFGPKGKISFILALYSTEIKSQWRILINKIRRNNLYSLTIVSARISIWWQQCHSKPLKLCADAIDSIGKTNKQKKQQQEQINNTVHFKYEKHEIVLVKDVKPVRWLK